MAALPSRAAARGGQLVVRPAGQRPGSAAGGQVKRLGERGPGPDSLPGAVAAVMKAAAFAGARIWPGTRPSLSATQAMASSLAISGSTGARRRPSRP